MITPILATAVSQGELHCRPQLALLVPVVEALDNIEQINGHVKAYRYADDTALTLVTSWR